MAYSNDPSSLAGANASPFLNTRLTAEEAERLAATFRPSWEADPAPFSGAANMPDGDLHGLGAAARGADVRSAVLALNGTHAPAPATVLNEPESSVIIDPAVVAPEPPPVAPPAQARTLVIPAHADVRRGAPAPSRSATTVVIPRTPVVSLEAGDLEFASRSRTGLWVGLGAAAAVAIAVGIWVASSGQDNQAAPVPSVQKSQPTAENRVPPPPPRAEPTAAAAAPPTPPHTAAAPPPTAATPVAVATPPPAPPLPRLVVPPAPRPPTWTPPAARPAPPARPKGGATIVREVPF